MLFRSKAGASGRLLWDVEPSFTHVALVIRAAATRKESRFRQSLILVGSLFSFAPTAVCDTICARASNTPVTTRRRTSGVLQAATTKVVRDHLARGPRWTCSFEENGSVIGDGWCVLS